ncbi:MAG: hypothetical protein HYU68_00875 [Bacteroidetes bacterium]|nr:hypothetical protein [Bacteroidota bacterium]
MKGKINIFLVALSLLVLPTISKAQYCNYFHTEFCSPSENEMYKPNGQSKSALFSKGQTSELSVIVYKGQDYRISLCNDENLGSQLTFKVYETKRVKVEKVVEKKEKEDLYDADGNPTGEQKDVITKETRIVEEMQKELLYDNSTDNYASELEFTVETTRRLILEISIPDAGGEGKAKGVSQGKGKLMKSSEMGCVGILIEHMTTAKQGFYGTGF